MRAGAHTRDVNVIRSTFCCPSECFVCACKSIYTSCFPMSLYGNHRT